MSLHQRFVDVARAGRLEATYENILSEIESSLRSGGNIEPTYNCKVKSKEDGLHLVDRLTAGGLTARLVESPMLPTIEVNLVSILRDAGFDVEVAPKSVIRFQFGEGYYPSRIKKHIENVLSDRQVDWKWIRPFPNAILEIDVPSFIGTDVVLRLDHNSLFHFKSNDDMQSTKVYAALTEAGLRPTWSQIARDLYVDLRP